MINFYKGESSKVNSVPADGILFTDDTHEIMVNKKAYGKTTHADEAKTTAPIVVAGGPLAENLGDWPTDATWNVGGNKVIPTGTSVQDVLRKLFLKPRNGSAEWGTFTWKPSLEAPTVTFQTKDDSGNNVKVPDATTVVEVGTTLYVKVQDNDTVSGNTRSITCTCDEGHFLSTTGTWQSGSYTHSTPGQKSGTLATAYIMEVTPPGDTKTTTSISNFTSETTAITIEYGKNEFKAAQSGITATVDALTQFTVYPSTNEKTVISTASTSPQDNSSVDARTQPLTSTGSDTIQGSYYYYYGSVSGTGVTIDSNMIKGLSTKDFVYNLNDSVLESSVVVPGQSTYIIAVPEEYTITQLKKLTADGRGAWTSNGNPKQEIFVDAAGTKTKKYNIFYCENLSGVSSEFVQLKLGKK